MPVTGRRSLKKTICLQCKMQVKEEEEAFIECDKCNNTFHALCTKLDKRQFEILLSDDNKVLECHVCAEKKEKHNKTQSGGNGGLQSELQMINSKLTMLDEIKTTVDFMSKQYDDILKTIKDNRKIINDVQKENKVLKTEVAQLKASVKILSDARVKNDCVVNGMKVDDGVSAVDAVLKLSKTVGADLEPQNIDDAFFMHNKNKAAQKKSIVVKFSSKHSKEKLMSVKSKLKESEDTRAVYVIDFLSRETMELLNYARTLRSVGYVQVYANGGRVFCKKSGISKPHLIKDMREVDVLLLNTTSGKPWERRSTVNRQEVNFANENEEEEDDDDDGAAAYVSP